jgi:DNA polymerase III subunit epsilon
MKLAAFYDTETTGLPLWGDPSDHPKQPHIVQLGALLVDLDTRSTVATIDVIVRPQGWDIPPDVTAIHGITTEHAREVGIPEKLALRMLLALTEGRVRIAHNESFDARIVRIGLKRYFDEQTVKAWADGQSECTADLATPILELPPTEKMVRAGFKKPKRANLREAYRHFFRHDFAGAHSALADAQACRDVYLAIREHSARGVEAAA